MATTSARSPAGLAQRDLSARQAVLGAVVALFAVASLDIVTDGHIGGLYSTGFVLICLTVAMAVDIGSIFAPLVLPPLLLVGTIATLALLTPEAIASTAATDGFGQRLIIGVIDNALALVVGHVLALMTIALRILAAPNRVRRGNQPTMSST